MLLLLLLLLLLHLQVTLRAFCCRIAFPGSSDAACHM
jgi:hypothetical protein